MQSHLLSLKEGRSFHTVLALRGLCSLGYTRQHNTPHQGQRGWLPCEENSQSRHELERGLAVQLSPHRNWRGNHWEGSTELCYYSAPSSQLLGVCHMGNRLRMLLYVQRKSKCYEIFIWKVIKSCSWKANLSQHKNHHAAWRLTHSHGLWCLLQFI